MGARGHHDRDGCKSLFRLDKLLGRDGDDQVDAFLDQICPHPWKTVLWSPFGPADFQDDASAVRIAEIQESPAQPQDAYMLARRRPRYEHTDARYLAG